MRTCTRCGSLGPFNKQKGGWTSRCRECTKAASRRYREAYPEKGRAARKRWALAHPDEVRAGKARYRETHREKCNAVTAAWQKRYPEKMREKARKWQAENPEGAVAWKAANANRLVQYRRRGGQKHPDKVRAFCQARRARVAGAPGRFGVADWRVILDVFGHRCAYCLRSDVKLTQDHVVALSRGGEHDASNIVPACSSCNTRKGDRPIWFILRAS